MTRERNDLDDLIAQMELDVGDGRGLRSRLEERLSPLVRCVLRTGAGPPHLVRWVRRLSRILTDDDGGPGKDHTEQHVQQLARLLSATLLDRWQAAPGKGPWSADTVRG